MLGVKHNTQGKGVTLTGQEDKHLPVTDLLALSCCMLAAQHNKTLSLSGLVDLESEVRERLADASHQYGNRSHERPWRRSSQVHTLVVDTRDFKNRGPPAVGTPMNSEVSIFPTGTAVHSLDPEHDPKLLQFT